MDMRLGILSKSNESCRLIFITSLVHSEKRCGLSSHTSYSDNANFSFAGKSRHLEWNSPLINLPLQLRSQSVTKEGNIKNFVKS